MSRLKLSLSLCALFMLAAPSVAYSESQSNNFHRMLNLTGVESIRIESPPGMITLAPSSSSAGSLSGVNINESDLSIKKIETSLVIGASDAFKAENKNKIRVSTSPNSKGSITINGQKLTPAELAKQSGSLTLTLPVGLKLNLIGQIDGKALLPLESSILKLLGTSRFKISHVYGTTQVDLAGSARVEIEKASDSLKLTQKGASKLALTVTDLILIGTQGGASRLSAKGKFSSVKLSTKATAKAELQGDISGDAELSTSGVSRIKHSGKIAGNLKSKQHGISKILTDAN